MIGELRPHRELRCGRFGGKMPFMINTLSFMLRLILAFGFAFLIPLVVLMLNLLGVIKVKYLVKFRVHIVVACFLFSAVATPSTDPISMLALAVPLSVLFLAVVRIAHSNEQRRARRDVGGSGIALA